MVAVTMASNGGDSSSMTTNSGLGIGLEHKHVGWKPTERKHFLLSVIVAVVVFIVVVAVDGVGTACLRCKSAVAFDC